MFEPGALRRFMAEVAVPVNIARLPQAPSVAELAALGVARISWGPLLHMEAMTAFADRLSSIAEPALAR